MIEIYTDGNARGNPGKGGWGVIVVEDGKIINAYRGSADYTTNNRMEMSAIIFALETFDKQNPIVYSDSAYCVNSFTDWIKGWKANGWTRAGGKKLENLDLIKRYDDLIQQGYSIDLRKCKGHSDNLYNEVADGLATGRLTIEDVTKENNNES